MANPRRQSRQIAAPSASIIPISTRPRLMPGDFVELIGSVLPQNLGRIAVVTDLYADGWVGIESRSGPLAHRDRETGKIHASGTLTCCVQPQNLYRLDRNSVVKGAFHV